MERAVQPVRHRQAEFTASTERRARRVLAGNWTGNSTVPSPNRHPHQWSWDSAFIAIGLRHVSAPRAQRELTTLLAAQWRDGRVPQIVFNPAAPHGACFPGAGFWRSSTAGRAAGAPVRTETSGIVQPPVHALAVWLVHRADPAASWRRAFLRRTYPRLVAWHRYLTRRRDLAGQGLVCAVHPWEPGMDTSPCWDGPLARVIPAPAGSYRRADRPHADADRPADAHYGRYVRLAADYRDRGYADRGTTHAFAVEDPGTNALLGASEHALAQIALALGTDPGPHLERVQALTDAMVRRLWDAEAGQFLCRDLRADARVRRRSAAGLFPLVLPGLPPAIATALLRTAEGAHFGPRSRVGLIPSFDLHDPAFDPGRYWSGPAWFNVNWLLERGLRQHGYPDRADTLRAAMITAARTSGFAECVDPYTVQGHGARDFSWTAALTLDLLAEPEGGIRS